MGLMFPSAVALLNLLKFSLYHLSTLAMLAFARVAFIVKTAEVSVPFTRALFTTYDV